MGLKTLGRISAILTILIIIGAVWWWALFGMSTNVQTAWMITGLITAGLTFAVITTEGTLK